MKKMLALLLATCFIAASVTACGGNSAEPQVSNPPAAETETPAAPEAPVAPEPAPAPAEAPPADVEYLDKIVHQVGAQPFTVLNPLVPASNAAPNHWIFMMIFDRLVEQDYYNNVAVPSLATDWTISDDYTKFTFNLRDDVVFHNGAPFTAQDVADTIGMTGRPFETEGPAGEISPFGSNARDIWAQVAEANVLGDYQIELVLESPNFEFIMELGNSAAAILNKAAIIANDQTGPRVGTGAYIVTDFASGEYAEFERNENYWGEMPVTKYQRWVFTPEAAAKVVDMQNGTNHIAQGIGPRDIEAEFLDNPDFGMLYNLLGGGFGVFFNMNDPITGDINFRKAVFSAVQREPIAQIVEGQFAIVETTGSNWSLYPSTYRYDGIPALPYDTSAAEAFLAESSYNGEEIKIAAATFHQIQIANTIIEQIRQVGINATLEQMELPAMNDWMGYGSSEGQMAVMMGQMAPGANSSYKVFAPEQANNKTNYNNPEVTALLDQAVASVSETERQDLYKQIQELIAADMPILMLYYRNNPVVTTAGFGGVTPPYDSGMWDLRNAYVIAP